jgi:hypothetical protein
MHKQTQSIRRQSDRYVDESELPFTTAAGDPDPSVAGGSRDGEQRAPRATRSEQRNDRETAAG